MSAAKLNFDRKETLCSKSVRKEIEDELPERVSVPAEADGQVVDGQVLLRRREPHRYDDFTDDVKRDAAIMTSRDVIDDCPPCVYRLSIFCTYCGLSPFLSQAD